METEEELYDFAVLGAGYGGLAAAALLAKRNYKVLLIEAHTVIGGCASYFKKRSDDSFELFTFDVGATTLSGLLPNQPIGKLINELELYSFSQKKIKHLDIGMVIKLDGEEIIRYANFNRWVKEAQDKFCDADNFYAQTKMYDFWKEIYEIDQLSWDLLSNNKKLPPASINDLFAAAKLSNLNGIKLIPGLFLSIMELVKKHGLEDNQKFIRFLEEQILITTQNSLEKSPYMTSALGLAYPSETYYPYGGIYSLGQEVLKRFKSYGGEAALGQKVTKINKQGSHFELLTNEGSKSFRAEKVVSNIPLWSMAQIDSNIKSYKKHFNKLSEKYNEAWGAFTVNFAIQANFPIKSAYYQIHTQEPVPFCDSKSFFATFSLDDDKDKAPLGWHTVTISLHTKVDYWKDIAAQEYNVRKQAAQDAIMSEFFRVFPEASEAKIKFLCSGTPNTFNHYANRDFVGGIPHSVDQNLLLLPQSKTPIKNLYMVGDTSFPGQGIPSVIYSAFNMVNSL